MQFLPQARISGTPQRVDFSPVSNGLVDLANSVSRNVERGNQQKIGDHVADGNLSEASREAARQGKLGQSFKLDHVKSQQEKDALDQERRLALKTAGFIQNHIDPISDPSQKTMAVRRLIGSNPDFAPELTRAGVDIRNTDQVISFLKAEAAEYVDPIKRETDQARLENIRVQTDATRASIARAAGSNSESRVLKVGDRLVRVGPDGQAEEVYSAPESDNGQFKDLKQRADVEQGLRKEFATLAKPFFEVRDAFNRVEGASRKPSAAGDLALIFNYMKMLDPGSVVREGEFATAQNAAGIPSRIVALYNNVLRGERLADDQRADFVGQARGLFKVQSDQYRRLQEQYRGISDRLELDERNTILDFSRPKQEASSSVLNEARAAIQRGASREKVIERLRRNGIDPSGL